MIHHTDVRVGNLVEYEGQIFEIDTIAKEFPTLNTSEFGIGVVDWKDLNGIPLTEEWLIKFGFRYEYKTGPQESQYSLKCDKGEFLVHFDKMANFGMILLLDDIELKSVHQLQNLYFALTGKELTIKDNV